MPLNTLGVVSAVTPSVIETYFSHFLNRGPLRQKPTAHISYHEGLRLIRQFLDYSSKHSVEDLQAFTAQWVPAPVWCKLQDVDIPAAMLERSAELVRAQLGPKGVELVGGATWWRWRRPEQPMRAEWIEMRKDYNEWKRQDGRCDRAILYVHGGAYYFGSVDEHRYQIQRHARKLKARVLAPRYRLAPQFPFPCGLYDCIAAYLYLLEFFAPSQILIAGDSAGGGMVLSMLVTLRDQGQPLPAGTMLLSPWVDLTHSFPSTAGDGAGDYIPPHGFHHRPSMVWPPPNSDELQALAAEPIKKKKSKDNLASAAQTESKTPSTDHDLTIEVDGQTIQIKDQIQLYSTNHMLAHPLVSPVQQASLGGLPPMLVQVGGAELLRDEQIYLAHKAANPKAYPPGERVITEYGLNRDDITKYASTDVQLQVWDDLCHVPHTLSFTRPAKYMYRSVAQFGAWALAHAQHKPIVIMDDDQISIISSGPETDNEANTSTSSLGSEKGANGSFPKKRAKGSPTGAVGKAGDPLPRFKEHMIRQRVDRHGITYPLALPGELACLHLDPLSIGAIKPGPVRKWMARKKETDTKFANDKKKVQKKRLKEMQQGYDVIGDDERPPPTALAGRRRADMPAEKRIKKSWGLAMWSGWGSSHDESTIERTDKLERQNSVRSSSPAQSVQEITPGSASVRPLVSSSGMRPESAQRARRTSGSSRVSAPWSQRHEERPGSPYTKVTDAGQADERPPVGGSLRPPSPGVSHRSRPSTSAASILDSRPGSRAADIAVAGRTAQHQQQPSNASSSLTALPMASPTTNEVQPGSTRVEGSDNTFQSPGNNRPHNGTVAYPFKIRNPMPTATGAGNASTTTLNSDEADSAGPSSSSAATPQPDYSDKEMVVPFHEKEVVLNSADPSTPTDGRSTHFRLRNMPSDPRLVARLDTQILRPASPSGSVPASPAGSQSERGNPFHARNPAFDPRTANHFRPPASPHVDAITPVSPSPLSQDAPRSPALPKPVGFTYSPRDLRNAMLSRQAAETAAAANQSQSQSQPHSQQTSYTNSPVPTPPVMGQDYAGPSFAAVELPAISVPQRRPSLTRGDSTVSRASEHPRSPMLADNNVDFSGLHAAPVELAARPLSARNPNPTNISAPNPSAPTSATATSPTSPPSSRPLSPASPSSQLNTTALRENLVQPAEQPRRQVSPSRVPPPPPPPKDDPATVSLIRKMSAHSVKRAPVNGNGGSSGGASGSGNGSAGGDGGPSGAPVIGEIPGLPTSSGPIIGQEEGKMF